MEFMPRITRAQSMDVLSSQANLAGYQAVIDAAAEYGRALADDDDAGRHGARRPGSSSWASASPACRRSPPRAASAPSVTATDVRPATKEQVESLGAKFVAVEDEEFKQAETAGGYAKEMSAPSIRPSRPTLVADHIAKQDIVITTALIPGRPAPKLVTRGDGRDHEARLGDRRSRGRARRQRRADASPARSCTTNGVKIVGHLNVPGRSPPTPQPLRQEPLRLPRDADRQERQDAGGQLGRRSGQGRRC